MRGRLQLSTNSSKEELSEIALMEEDKNQENNQNLTKVLNIIKVLNLNSCKNVVIGNDIVRGVSGGEKRRVTLAELLCTPKSIKCLDAISNGLDAKTIFDIINILKISTHILKLTLVISLLQVYIKYVNPV